VARRDQVLKAQVIPIPIGSVDSLVDERLLAAVTAGDPEGFDGTYEIQLTHRPDSGRPDWKNRIWSDKGTPVEDDPADDEDDPDDDDESPERPLPPHFETLDGCPTAPGMVVRAQSPKARLSTDEPVDAFRWRLRQDDEVVDGATDVKAGIIGGTCIVFAPTFRLRRGRPVDQTKPTEGEFRLPFEKGLHYRSETYAQHSDFAVDFNRNDRQDRREWVFAPAPGKVQRVFRGERGNLVNGLPSEVYIRHPGRYQTVYAHMAGIQVHRGDRVVAGQRLGRVSNVGAPGGPHLHLQIRRLPTPTAAWNAGKPIKMVLGGKRMLASIFDSESRPKTWKGKFGQILDGVGPATKQVAPELRVAVRRASDQRWSRFRRLRFLVAPTRDEGSRCIDPGCNAADAPGGTFIDHVYDGPDLPVGRYVLRYRLKDRSGNHSDWAVDDSLVVTG
jgi:murein DD-endopeptidase MepM/ murein hydrolase activator NlpD